MRTSQYSSVCSRQPRPIGDSRRKRSSAASSSHRHIAIWRRGSTSPIVKPSLRGAADEHEPAEQQPAGAASRRRATNRLRAASRGERKRKRCVEATGTIAQANRSPGGPHRAPERQTARARRAVLPGGRCGCLCVVWGEGPLLGPAGRPGATAPARPRGVDRCRCWSWSSRSSSSTGSSWSGSSSSRLQRDLLQRDCV